MMPIDRRPFYYPVVSPGGGTLWSQTVAVRAGADGVKGLCRGAVITQRPASSDVKCGRIDGSQRASQMDAIYDPR